MRLKESTMKLTHEIKRAGSIVRAIRDYELYKTCHTLGNDKRRHILEHAELAARSLLELQGVTEPSNAQVQAVLLYSDN